MGWCGMLMANGGVRGCCTVGEVATGCVMGFWRRQATWPAASITAAHLLRVAVRGARSSIARWASLVQPITQPLRARLRSGLLLMRRGSESGPGVVADRQR